jgi:hypothetical protein
VYMAAYVVGKCYWFDYIEFCAVVLCYTEVCLALFPAVQARRDDFKVGRPVVVN